MTLPVLLWLQAALLTLVVGAVLFGRWRAVSSVVYGASLVVSGSALAVAGHHLLTQGVAVEQAMLPLGIPWMGAHFRVDGLSAFFLVVVNLGAAAASLYSLGHGRDEPEPRRVLPFFGPFLAAMNLVVLSDDAFTFLLAWELMSVVSWAMVLAHHREPANVHGGFVYLVMASFGTLALVLAFGLMAGVDGSFMFEQIRAEPVSDGLAALVLVLTLVGVGSKAGLVPLHVWLPLAHPAAPSQVSALMSGVMTKVALYGFVRIVFDLMGPPAWWWGGIVLVLGGTTAALGVLYALMQHDLKRLLAYSTVENIGIILIGLGLALAFRANGTN